MNEQVSVLMRTRNRLDSLQKAIESVLNQSYEFIEIIIVNDAGQPVDEVLSEFDFKNRSYRLVNLANNGGRSVAANKALINADSKYALFLDDDDIIEQDHITNLVAKLANEANSTIAVYTGYQWFDEKGSYSSNEQIEPWQLIVSNQYPIHSVLFCLDKVKQFGIQFDPSLALYEDWDFWLQLAVKGEFVHVPGFTAHYYANNSSGVQDPNNVIRKEAEFHVWNKWRSKWPKNWFLFFMEQRHSSNAIAEEMRKQRGQIETELTKCQLSYTEEIEKLQKEIDKLQKAREKDRERLQKEIEILQDEIENLQKAREVGKLQEKLEIVALQEKIEKLQTEEIKQLQQDNDLLVEDNLRLKNHLKWCPIYFFRKVFSKVFRKAKN